MDRSVADGLQAPEMSEAVLPRSPVSVSLSGRNRRTRKYHSILCFTTEMSGKRCGCHMSLHSQEEYATQICGTNAPGKAWEPNLAITFVASPTNGQIGLSPGT